MAEKWIGEPLRPCTHEPSHCPEWLQTSAQTALIGLLEKSSAPASSSLRSRKSSITCGIDVETGQPLSWQNARLQPRQRLASSMM